MINNVTLSSAQPHQDYLEIKQRRLVFGQETAAVCTPIDIIDDDALESTESFTVLLEAAVEDSAVVGFSTQRATVQILEDAIDGMYIITVNFVVQMCSLLTSN